MKIQVAELFASLRISPEKLDEVDKFLNKAGQRVGKLAGRLNKEWGAKLGGALKYGALGAAAALGVATKDALDFDALLGDIAIGSDGAVGSIEILRDKILKLSAAVGVSKEEIAGGVKKFVELTGDGKTAADSMEVFAKVAKATKAEMSDIAEVAAAMSQQMKIGSPEFEKAFSILIAGGKAGSVEFKNMAALLSEVSAAGSKFQGVTGTEGLASLSSAFQLVRQGFGGPQGANKAATSLVSLMGELGDKAKILRKNGIRVWEKDPTGKLVRRNFKDIVKDLAKLNGQKRAEIFGLDASKALDELLKVEGAWDRLTETSRKANDLSTDFAKRQALASEKAANAWNLVKVRVAEAFTPERLQAFAELLGKSVELAIDLAGWVGEILGASNKIENQDVSRNVDDFVLGKKGKKGNYEQGLRDLVAAGTSNDAGQMRDYFGPHGQNTKSVVAANGDATPATIETLVQNARQKLAMIENTRKADRARMAARETARSIASAPGTTKIEVDAKVSLDTPLLKAEVTKTVKGHHDAAMREAMAGTSTEGAR